MALLDDLEHDISDVLSASWNLRDGEVVPSTENVALSGGGVKIAATMLYADLAESTALAMWDRRVAARVCKAFLAFASRLIRASDGAVRLRWRPGDGRIHRQNKEYVRRKMRPENQSRI